jgi:hypothetical protein
MEHLCPCTSCFPPIGKQKGPCQLLLKPAVDDDDDDDDCDAEIHETELRLARDMEEDDEKK